MDLQPYDKDTTHPFYRRQQKQRRIDIFIPIAIFFTVIGGGMLGFYVLNAAAYQRIQPLPVVQATPTPLPTPEVTAIAPTPAPTPSIPSLPENTVAYGDLGISAPVFWDTPFEDKIVNKQLEEGVIHIKGTPRPGEQGMSVLFGHSSNYPWAKGNYKTVFAPLLNAAVGQTVDMQYAGITYRYKVTKSYEIKATQVEVLNSDPAVSGVRLITCTPLGTSLRRHVVEAVQEIPTTQGNKPFQQEAFSGSLPADR